jgi:DNA-binding transcriptional ArsR family regulator
MSSESGTAKETRVSQPGTPSLLRAMNDRAALDLLLTAGPLTRTEIGSRTGLSKVTASQLLGRLEQRGLVQVVGSQSGSRGPNAALYGVVGSVGHAAGVDVGPDGITVAVADITGELCGEVTVAGGTDDLIGCVPHCGRPTCLPGRCAAWSSVRLVWSIRTPARSTSP